MSTTEGAHELTDVMDQLVDNTEGETITLDELFRSLDSRSYGPLLLVVGLIAISPIGGIPGMSLVTGSLIMILCLQMMMGRSHPWLPERLMSIEFPRERLERTVDSGRPWAKWLETALHRRLSVLTKGPALIGIGVISILLAITFFPLALVPFGVFVPGLAITLLALGVTARDGLLVLLGYAGAIVAIVLMFVYWPF